MHTDYYIKRALWVELLQEATDNPAITQVAVHKLRRNEEKRLQSIREGRGTGKA